ncbi:MAG: hypothetical protein ACRC9K_00185 [Afipia sp.]
MKTEAFGSIFARAFMLHCEFESRLTESLVFAFELMFTSFRETNAVNGLQANSSGRETPCGTPQRDPFGRTRCCC